MLDVARYAIALFLLVGLPPLLAFWFLIHPFAGFWRRRGVAVTYTVACSMILAIAIALFLLRGPLLAIEFGSGPLFWVGGAISLGVALVFDVMLRRELSATALIGLPEVAPSASGQGLLIEGIYARVRHPRYTGGVFITLGLALLSNYLAAWLIFALYFPAIYALTLFEERELVDRFGEAYERYREQVPRFLPSLTASR